ncbi:ADP-ribose 1''-phosphate phosphatase [Histoplasma capsulatum H143]|uniref:ADP-ribose 1''-phosphate phosphatase n=1 Tax=Ajellomyces capsulatus (strain H143) TaxID=544712 RepID=C6HND0_AJECH|nr:ADP-ribose 1''-phosphate phosphatase [Histoplasma capsulatum H143]
MSIITEIQGDLFDAPEGAALIHACNCQGSWGKGIAATFKEKYPAAYRIFRSHCQQYLSHPQTWTQTQTETRPIPVRIPGTDPSRQQPRALKLPEGTALIIPPQPADYQPQPQPQTAPLSNRGRGRGRGRGRAGGGALRGSRGLTALSRPAGKKHWIICLFTSWHYGRWTRSPPDVILENTMSAVADLKRQIAAAAAASSTTSPATTTTALAATGGCEEEQLGELWGCRLNAGLFGVPWERTRAVLEEAGLAVTIAQPLGSGYE